MFLSRKTVYALLSLSLLISIILPGCSQERAAEETFAVLTEETEMASETYHEEPAVLEEEEEDRLSEEEIKKLERIILEERLKEELGLFFVPLAPAEGRDNPRIKAKGFYVTANSAGFEERFEGFIEMIETTELNSMVIDVKNDHGLMTYPSEIKIVDDLMEGYLEPVRDIKALISRLEEKDIYPIARIVVLRDPYLPEFHPEWAIQKKDGGVWRDDKGFSWVNPYEKNVWDYNIAIAKEAALMGFREIQFDYVRFPEDAQNLDAQVSFPGQGSIAKDEIIRYFLEYAYEELKDYDVYLSADVFGVIATYFQDKDKIGQNWEKITSLVDYIYPMVYPSHYSSGFFGLSVPDADPSETILRAMEDAVKRNAAVKDPAVIRPWLQGFTATWINGNIKYGPKQIREQIDAVLERGIEEFFIWNASNQYDSSSFISEEEALKRQEEARENRAERGLDFLGRSKKEAFEEYLETMAKKDWKQVYPLQGTDFTMDFNQFFTWAQSWTFDSLESEMITDGNLKEDSFFDADVTLKNGDRELFLKKERFEVYMESGIWKIKPSPSFIEALSSIY